MKKALCLTLAALLGLLLLSACAKTEEPPAPAPEIVYVTVTPEPAPEAQGPVEPPLEDDALPLELDPGPGSFPGGLDDDGRGPDEGGELYPWDDVTAVQSLEMTADRQYEANIFLSNFAEQGFRFYSYDMDMSQIMGQLVRFAHIWCKVNRQSEITYSTFSGVTCETLTAEQVDAVVSRFFPSVTREDADLYYIPPEHSFYRDGTFYFEAADGEAHNRIAVAEGVTVMSDGTCFITFGEYEIDLETYYSFDGGIPRSYYELTASQAAERADLTLAAVGASCALPHDYQGRASYQLLEYSVW